MKSMREPVQQSRFVTFTPPWKHRQLAVPLEPQSREPSPLRFVAMKSTPTPGAPDRNSISGTEVNATSILRKRVQAVGQRKLVGRRHLPDDHAVAARPEVAYAIDYPKELAEQ
jgi:hypothetical protein